MMCTSTHIITPVWVHQTSLICVEVAYANSSVAPARHVHPLLFMRVEPCSQPSGLSRIHRPLGTRKFFHLLGYTHA